MQLEKSKIFYILLSSIFLSLLYNTLSGNGINLIRKEKKVFWENDSTDFIEESDSVDTPQNIDKPILSIDSLSLRKKIIMETEFAEPRAIRIEQAYKLFNAGNLFVDARSVEEFNQGHIQNSINIPFYGSEDYMHIVSKFDKNKIIVIYCSSAECDISNLSGEEFFSLGFKKVYVFIGGYDEWTKFNYPTERLNN